MRLAGHDTIRNLQKKNKNSNLYQTLVNIILISQMMHEF